MTDQPANYCPSCDCILPPGQEPRYHWVAYIPFIPADCLLGEVQPVQMPCWVAQHNIRLNKERQKLQGSSA